MNWNIQSTGNRLSNVYCLMSFPILAIYQTIQAGIFQMSKLLLSRWDRLKTAGICMCPWLTLRRQTIVPVLGKCATAQCNPALPSNRLECNKYDGTELTALHRQLYYYFSRRVNLSRSNHLLINYSCYMGRTNMKSEAEAEAAEVTMPTLRL